MPRPWSQQAQQLTPRRRTVAHLGDLGCCVHIHTGNLSLATGGERVSAVSSFYPNPWRKKCWGPLTVFRVGAANHTNLFRFARSWPELIASPKYEHFDEWWGQRYETMGEVTYM